MAQPRLPLLWVILHSLLMLIIIVSLLTGLRIATVSDDSLHWLSPILPQGYLHELHVLSGLGLVSTVVIYLLTLLTTNEFKNTTATQKQKKKSLNNRYHHWVTWYGYVVIVLMMLSGLALFFEVFNTQLVATMHYWMALGMVLYLILHSAVYFVQYGIAVFKRIFFPSRNHLKPSLALTLLLLTVYVSLIYGLPSNNYSTLNVKSLDISRLIKIDGKSDEAEWSNTESITVSTHGGANFINGQTDITVKALSNGQEAFFHIQWQDPTQSLKHLPLIKSESGWQVEHDGFYHFDERQHYEDKLAVLISNTCKIGADGTAHLGRKPLANKPANWHGKGYHYSTDGSVKDMWHWKAVRTNDMKQADDNFFGPPKPHYSGNRRYKAGYGQDGKESGSYVMNWEWFKADGVTPKRLPKNPDILKPFQSSAKNPTLDWVIPWFQYQPYNVSNDHYSVGTVMPSVMYRSNQFEGDRADVRAYATWSDGFWSLELSRRLDTQSENDVVLQDGVCMWISAFDHSQIAHTRHNRPIKLQFNKE